MARFVISWIIYRDMLLRSTSVGVQDGEEDALAVGDLELVEFDLFRGTERSHRLQSSPSPGARISTPSLSLARNVKDPFGSSCLTNKHRNNKGRTTKQQSNNGGGGERKEGRKEGRKKEVDVRDQGNAETRWKRRERKLTVPDGVAVSSGVRAS